MADGFEDGFDSSFALLSFASFEEKYSDRPCKFHRVVNKRMIATTALTETKLKILTGMLKMKGGLYHLKSSKDLVFCRL